MAEQRKLTIESTYCKDWTIKDAIREVVQNAIDTKTEVTFEQSGNQWTVKDKGIGLRLCDFLIGRSSKQSDASVIGQFGEGLKIACLVLARNNRAITVNALGKQYKFSFQYDKEWDSQLLTIDIDNTPPKVCLPGFTTPNGKGTSVAIECSTEELDEARKLFLKLNPKPIIDRNLYRSDGNKTGAEFLECPGEVYVQGLLVTTIQSLFGYNFYRKELVNRDRSAVGFEAVKNCIANALSATGNIGIIQKIISTAVSGKSEAKQKAEFQVMFQPRRSQWKRAITELYGDKVCLSADNPAIDLRATERHYKVLDLPWNLAWSLRGTLLNAKDVIKEKKRIIPFNRLKAEEKNFYQKAKKLADEIAGEVGLTVYPLKVFVDAENKEELGYYGGGIAGICYETIQRQDLSGALRTILHEYVHGTSGEPDNSRGFENALGDVIASLALKYNAEKCAGMKKWTLVDLRKAQGKES